MKIQYWSNLSGQFFTFHQFSYNELAKQDEDGIYIFAAFDPATNSWVCLYIGKTNSFCRRSKEHRYDKWLSAVQLGAHAVFAAYVPNEADRKTLEDELIKRYSPILNIQNNPEASAYRGLAAKISSAPGLGIRRLADSIGKENTAPSLGIRRLADSRGKENTAPGLGIRSLANFGVKENTAPSLGAGLGLARYR